MIYVSNGACRVSYLREDGMVIKIPYRPCGADANRYEAEQKGIYYANSRLLSNNYLEMEYIDSLQAEFGIWARYRHDKAVTAFLLSEIEKHPYYNRAKKFSFSQFEKMERLSKQKGNLQQIGFNREGELRFFDYKLIDRENQSPKLWFSPAYSDVFLDYIKSNKAESFEDWAVRAGLKADEKVPLVKRLRDLRERAVHEFSEIRFC